MCILTPAGHPCCGPYLTLCKCFSSAMYRYPSKAAFSVLQGRGLASNTSAVHETKEPVCTVTSAGYTSCRPYSFLCS